MKIKFILGNGLYLILIFTANPAFSMERKKQLIFEPEQTTSINIDKLITRTCGKKNILGKDYGKLDLTKAIKSYLTATKTENIKSLYQLQNKKKKELTDKDFNFMSTFVFKAIKNHGKMTARRTCLWFCKYKTATFFINIATIQAFLWSVIGIISLANS